MKFTAKGFTLLLLVVIILVIAFSLLLAPNAKASNVRNCTAQEVVVANPNAPMPITARERALAVIAVGTAPVVGTNAYVARMVGSAAGAGAAQLRETQYRLQPAYKTQLVANCTDPFPED